MRRKALLLLAVLTLVLSAFSSASGASGARLAIIADPASGSAADLLTVELSKRQDIQLLERNQVDKILREQTLSGGTPDPLRLGQLIGAEGLILLETAKTGSPDSLILRLVAVQPGLVISVSRFSWPPENPVQWSAGLASLYEPLLPKLTVPGDKLVPLSVVNLRAAVPSPGAKETEKQLTVLTIERLSREKQLVVLERQRLNLLADEKNFSASQEQAFWSGKYLLDGTIDRDSFSRETLKLSARLIPPDKSAPIAIEISGSRSNPAAVVDQLAQKVLESLSLASERTAWDSAKEANEYFQEAQWAMRWGLFDQAQMASESAWALGGRSKDLAVLRMKSYGDSLLPGTSAFSSPSQMIAPELPDARRISSAIRALELFCNPPADLETDPEWLKAGLTCLQQTAMLLEGFYYAAELRSEHASGLAELRSRAREAEALLRKPAPSTPQSEKRDYVFWTDEHLEDRGSLARFLWLESGIWHEKPEDALPGIKRLLEDGHAPNRLPRIVGWNWSDRRRVPELTRSFVHGLCASSNLHLRLEGHYLELLRVPDSAAGVLTNTAAALFDEIWAHRSFVLTNAGKMTLLPRAERAMRDRLFSSSDSNYRFDNKQFLTFLHRLRMDYLRRTASFEKRTFDFLFQQNRNGVSIEEAQELLEPLEQLKARTPENVWTLNSALDEVRVKAGVKKVVAKPHPGIVSWPAETPLAVPFTAWNTRILKGQNIVAGLSEKPLLRQGRLWTSIPQLPGPMTLPNSSSGTFVGADLTTGHAMEIPFPPGLGFVFSSPFEVTEEALFACFGDRLFRFQFLDKKWTQMPVALEGQASITAMGGRLYLRTGSALLEVLPDSNTTQILASSRREPRMHELDSLWSGGASVFVRVDGQLGVRAADRIFAFDPVSRRWSVQPGPMTPSDLGKSAFCSQEGILWLSHGIMDRRQLFLTHHENQASELLLEQLNPRAPKAQQEAAAQANPLWNWPEPFRLDFPTFVLDRECLWMLHPRILPWGSGSNPDSEPIRFADARHATLLRFERGLTNAVQIPIEFRKDGQPADIFGFRHVLWNSYALRYLTLINSEEGLIVISSSHRGHWLIPRSEVSRWKSSTASNGERDVAQKHLPAAAVNNTNRIKAVTP